MDDKCSLTGGLEVLEPAARAEGEVAGEVVEMGLQRNR